MKVTDSVSICYYDIYWNLLEYGYSINDDDDDEIDGDVDDVDGGWW